MSSVQGKLAWSNIRKRKSSTATLSLLILLAVLLLNIGLSVTLKLNSFQEDKMTELQTPDLISYFATDEHLKEYESLIESYPYTDKWENEPVLLLSEAKMKYGLSDTSSTILILNVDQQRNMAPFKTTVQLESITPDMIFLPYMFHISAGYNLGDSYSFSYEKKDYAYKIGGFIEEPILGTFNNGSLKVFLPDKAYKELDEQIGKEAHYNLLSVNLTDSTQVEKLSQSLGDQLSASGTRSMFSVMSAESGITGNRIFVSILTAVLIAFALIMVVISLIVIRFQVLDHIEDNLLNIGVLKANGYTSLQIIGALLLQFTSISLAAVIPGIAVSALVMPFAGNLISASVGLIWPASFGMLSALLSLSIIMGMVLLIVHLSSKRIRTITPIAALQSGILTHNFTRNRIPLEHSRLSLQFALSLKSLIRQTKQNIMIVIIVAGLTFSCISCSILNFNFSGDTKAILRLVGLEQSSLMLILKSGMVKPDLIAEVESMEGVKKTSLLDSKVASIQDTSFLLKVSDDFDKMETQTVYKGRQPKYENEIAISGIISKLVGKNIGDEVMITTNNVTESYLISGLSQQINQLGMVATMTEEGVKRMVPDFAPSSLNVYMKEGADLNAFIQELEKRFPGQWDVTNIQEMLESTLSTFSSAVSSMTAVITVVTMIVVSLILYLVIKTLILKRKKEFGILKGMGYTTFNLMTQITFSLLPVITVGVMAGSLLGYFYSDTVFVLLLSSLGIYNIELAVSLPQVLLLCVAIIVVAYVVSMFVARRIKKISVYGLIMD
ncbi:ABC transporter permease [Paenibacillus wynnii]|uniref:ABC transporter permease n=1 Tax=Paenibacillus wynnii TaxID=268407 RepID=UPI00278CB54F|nr:ABC transporter permease [Paenibacillus wynnii]MDQ0194816.1 putative ABC transport system permease protein [Paenibacillus wynnii]